MVKMNNKPHTEREENMHCVRCELNPDTLEAYKFHKIEMDGWCAKCMRRVPLADVDVITKGKTAVTLYIPEGMVEGIENPKIGDIIAAAIVDHTMKTKGDAGLVCNGYYAMEYFRSCNAEQIQEAIDNTFPENK